MKNYRLLLCALPLLAGCSTLSSVWQHIMPHHRPAEQPLTLGESGLGSLTANTPMDTDHISQALADSAQSDYQLLNGMQTRNGDVIQYIEARQAGKTALQISGNRTISRIDILDPAISTDSGVNIGTLFSAIYQKAYNVCQREPEESVTAVVCLAPHSQHISYQFNGEWQGPEDLLPSDDVLQHWQVRKIIWQK